MKYNVIIDDEGFRIIFGKSGIFSWRRSGRTFKDIRGDSRNERARSCMSWNLPWTWPMGSLTYLCLLFKLNRAVYTGRPGRLNARYTPHDFSFAATSYNDSSTDDCRIRTYVCIRICNKVPRHEFRLVTNDLESDKVTRNKRCTVVICAW